MHLVDTLDLSPCSLVHMPYSCEAGVQYLSFENSLVKSSIDVVKLMHGVPQSDGWDG